MSCLGLPHLTLPYYVLPYYVLPCCLALPFLTMPFLTMPFLTISCLALLFLASPWLVSLVDRARVRSALWWRSETPAAASATWRLKRGYTAFYCIMIYCTVLYCDVESFCVTVFRCTMAVRVAYSQIIRIIFCDILQTFLLMFSLSLIRSLFILWLLFICSHPLCSDLIFMRSFLLIIVISCPLSIYMCAPLGGGAVISASARTPPTPLWTKWCESCRSWRRRESTCACPWNR